MRMVDIPIYLFFPMAQKDTQRWGTNAEISNQLSMPPGTL